MTREKEPNLGELEGIKLRMSGLEGSSVVDFPDCLRRMVEISNLILDYNEKLGRLLTKDIDGSDTAQVNILATARFSFSAVGENQGVIEKLCQDKRTGVLFLDDDLIAT